MRQTEPRPLRPSGARKSTQQRRREILDAALECFSSKGFGATTMADIRERAAASTGSIYHHFKSKEQLAAELYLDGVRSSQTHGIEALATHPNTELGIRALVEGYLDWVKANPRLAAFVFTMRHADFLQPVEEDLDRVQQAAIERATEWFRARMVAGELQNLPTEVVRAILYGPANHLARQWISSGAAFELEGAKKQLARAAWDALKGPRLRSFVAKGN
jgi:AcrR family transcriptional regulator